MEQLLGRFGGPMHFRLIMQPAMAIFLAIRAGFKDARENRPAFLWQLVTNPEERRSLIHSAWKDIGRLIIFAFVIDAAYQIFVFKSFYLLQTMIVTIALAVIPYVLLRGPITRVIRRMRV